MSAKMSRKSRPRRDSQSISDPPQSSMREKRESTQSREYQVFMQSIQALSASVQVLVAQQQQQQPKGLGVKKGVEPVPPLPLEMVELVEPIPTTVYHKAFKSAKPPNFDGKGGLDRAG